MADEPQRLTLVCRVLAPRRSKRPRPWEGLPWEVRVKQAFKALLRRWGIELISYTAEPADKPAEET